MPIEVKKPNWEKGVDEPTPVNERVAADFLNYILNTQRWRLPAELELRVRKLRQTLFVLDPASDPASDAATVALPDGTPVVVSAAAVERAQVVERAEAGEAGAPSRAPQKPRAKRGMVAEEAPR